MADTLRKYGTLALWIIAFESISAAIGRTTQNGVEGWYASLTAPALTPPNIVFPIMWTILYAMIASAGWVLWRARDKKCLGLFALYMALNWSWSFVFFGAHMLGLALAWIVAVDIAAIALIVASWKKARPASLLMIPPLLWTLFATGLSYGYWALN